MRFRMRTPTRQDAASGARRGTNTAPGTIRGTGRGSEKGQEKGKDKCTPEPDSQLCSGKCALVTNRCGTQVDCGPCTCATGCPQCQTCDTTTGRCVPNGSVVGQVCARSRSVGQMAGAVAMRAVALTGCCGEGGVCGACLAFVTSTEQNGNLGGLNGADAICRTRRGRRSAWSNRAGHLQSLALRLDRLPLDALPLHPGQLLQPGVQTCRRRAHCQRLEHAHGWHPGVCHQRYGVQRIRPDRRCCCMDENHDHRHRNPTSCPPPFSSSCVN